MKTPKGVFKYVWLNKPDTKFDADGVYTVTVVMDKENPKTQKLLKDLAAEHKKAVAEATHKWDEMTAQQKAKFKKKGITGPAAMPFYEDVVDDEGDPTGQISLRFKTKARIKSSRTGRVTARTVPFYDGRGNIIPDKKRPSIFAGTVGAVAFTPRGSYIPKDAEVYLSLYLDSVRILELKTAGGGGDDWDDDDDASDFDGSTLDDVADDDLGGDDDDDLDDDLGGGDDSNQPDQDDDDLDDEIPF